METINPSYFRSLSIKFISDVGTCKEMKDKEQNHVTNGLNFTWKVFEYSDVTVCL